MLHHDTWSQKAVLAYNYQCKSFFLLILCAGNQNTAMCDSMSTSEILTGASAVTLAPPLILLQSEEESGTEGRQVNTDNSAGTDAEVAGSAASQSAPPETSESSAAWSNTQVASSGQATLALSDAWNLDQVLAEVGLLLSLLLTGVCRVQPGRIRL